MATRDPNARLKYAKQEPAFNGALIDNDWIGAGLFVRQTNAQKLAIGKDFRVLDGDTTTIVMVTGGSEPLTYKLINNPDTEATQESDWQLLPSGGGSAVEPVGEFDAVTGFIVPSTTSLQDTDAVGNNGQYYVVTQAPTGITDTYAGLFRGLEVTLFDGDFVLSVGEYYAVVRPASTWDSIGVPQVVQDYVDGTVIAHNHTIAQVTGLTGALGLKYDVSNVASDLLDYDNNAGDELANKDFLDTYYYRKYGTGLDKSLTTYSASEIDALVVGVGAGSGLTAGVGSVIDLGGTMTSSVNLYWDEAISTPLEFSVYAENSNETKSSELRVKDDNIIVYADTADSYAQYYLTGETIGLQHEEYNLINKEQEIYFSPLFDFIRFRHNDGTNYDTFHGVAGLYYGDDYDALGISTHGDNWIPSYRAVKDYADNGSFWKLDGTNAILSGDFQASRSGSATAGTIEFLTSETTTNSVAYMNVGNDGSASNVLLHQDLVGFLGFGTNEIELSFNGIRISSEDYSTGTVDYEQTMNPNTPQWRFSVGGTDVIGLETGRLIHYNNTLRARYNSIGSHTPTTPSDTDIPSYSDVLNSPFLRADEDAVVTATNWSLTGQTNGIWNISPDRELNFGSVSNPLAIGINMYGGDQIVGSGDRRYEFEVGTGNIMQMAFDSYDDHSLNLGLMMRRRVEGPGNPTTGFGTRIFGYFDAPSGAVNQNAGQIAWQFDGLDGDSVETVFSHMTGTGSGNRDALRMNTDFHIFYDNQSGAVLQIDRDGDAGMGYSADYSTNGIIDFGDRWIPDKAYVDSVAGGGGSFWETSGTTTRSGNVIVTGVGDLTLEVTGGGSQEVSWKLDNNESIEGIVTTDGLDQTIYRQEDQSITLELISGGAAYISNFIMDTTGFYIIDSEAEAGLGYGGDYSTNGISTHGDRWIPDKAYVDSVAGGGGWAVSGTTTLTGDSFISAGVGSYGLYFGDQANNPFSVFEVAAEEIYLESLSSSLQLFSASELSFTSDGNISIDSNGGSNILIDSTSLRIWGTAFNSAAITVNTSDKNITILGNAPASYGTSANGVLYIKDAVTAPTTDPTTGGGDLYSEEGVLKWRSVASGVVDLTSGGGGGWALSGTTNLTGAVTIRNNAGQSQTYKTEENGVSANYGNVYIDDGYSWMGLATANAANTTAVNFIKSSATRFQANMQTKFGVATQELLFTHNTLSQADSTIYLRDTAYSKGMAYFGDYSTNGIADYGDRWIPDKGYADSAYWNTSGTTTLPADVTINRAGTGTNLQTILIDTDEIELKSVGDITIDQLGIVEVKSSKIRLYQGDNESPFEASFLDISNTETVFFSSRVGHQGIKLTGIDPANLVAQSLIPKSYADGAYVALDPIQEIRTSHVQLTQAQIQSLNTTPIEIVAAQGAGKHIQVIGASAYLNHNGTNYAGGSFIKLSGDGNASNFAQSSAGFISAAADNFQVLSNSSAAQAFLNNNALEIEADADSTGAGGTIDVYVQYVVIDTN